MRKEQLDGMSDIDYMAAVMRMDQEEKGSLMVSEAERLRTYRSLWPNPLFLDYRDLAREGFYYTGVSDRVQCAFCAGFLGNWEKGDVPLDSHKKFFSYCKMAQKLPCCNIPAISNQDLDSLTSNADAIEKVQRDVLDDNNISDSHTPVVDSSINIREYKTYQICSSHRRFSEEELEEAFKANSFADFSDVECLNSALQAIRDGDRLKLVQIVENSRITIHVDTTLQQPHVQEQLQEAISSGMVKFTEENRVYVDMEQPVKSMADLTAGSAALMVEALRCHFCKDISKKINCIRTAENEVHFVCEVCWSKSDPSDRVYI